MNEQEIQDANDLLMVSVGLPAFVKACQARGVPINTPEELQDALLISQTLHQVKAASSSGILSRARGDLESFAKSAGMLQSEETSLPAALGGDVKDALAKLTTNA